MTAMFYCNSAEDYENSQWTGQDIFDGMIKVYTGAYILWLVWHFLARYKLPLHDELL
ncbi:MAG: hypothetical protein Q9221_004026 [Calogaya cf. arnoldii]